MTTPQAVGPGAIETVKEIVERESQTLARYVIEVARPPVFGGRDGEALERFQDLYRESQRGIDALDLLLAEHEHVAREVHWPLVYTSYNYLRPLYLLRPVADHTAKHLRELAGLAARLERQGWPRALEVVRGLVSAEERELGRLRRLAEEVGELRADPPRVKGTSAARW
jgi:hypothetical protein